MRWRIATLILLLLVGVSAFMLMRNTDTEPQKVYKESKESSPEVIDNIRNKPQTQTPGTAEVPEGTDT
ncbi:hypothetical protein JT359_20060 [Candidatus Poribacteria bacterium]|nr:hypothetical protein [Candidatus Poribacteria bacterium]